MQPLSRKKRRVYLYGLIFLFIVLLPLVILYASGYRYKSGFGIVRTGGIHVTVPYDGAIIALDGEALGESGFLNRRFYVDDLIPGAYMVSVRKEGYFPWVHTLVVEGQIVTDSRAILIPEEIVLMRISSGTMGASTSTRIVSAEVYDAYMDAFRVPVATSTEGAVDVSGEEAIFLERGNVIVKWMNENVPPSSNFCGRPSFCLWEIPIEEGKQTATGAAYFGGGVVFRTKEGGVFLREGTILPGAVLAPIYPKRGSDFRILDGALIIKDGNNLYQVSL